MTSQTPPEYEEHFILYVDFLGFSEISERHDEERRIKILSLLQSLASLRTEFDASSQKKDDGSKLGFFQPAVTTFSDHIVLSYPVARLADALFDGNVDASAHIVMLNSLRTLQFIAAAALSIGLLIRGGATLGKLYHAGGVVFGEAMVQAARIESQTAVYPRVVLSHSITNRPVWVNPSYGVRQDHDGLHCMDYFSHLLMASSRPGDDWTKSAQTWHGQAVEVISRNLQMHRNEGKLKELAKWTYFAREYRRGMDKIDKDLLSLLGATVPQIP